MAARVIVTWAELEAAKSEAHAIVTWAECEAAKKTAHAVVTWAELECAQVNVQPELPSGSIRPPLANLFVIGEGKGDLPSLQGEGRGRVEGADRVGRGSSSMLRLSAKATGYTDNGGDEEVLIALAGLI